MAPASRPQPGAEETAAVAVSEGGNNELAQAPAAAARAAGATEPLTLDETMARSEPAPAPHPESSVAPPSATEAATGESTATENAVATTRAKIYAKIQKIQKTWATCSGACSRCRSRSTIRPSSARPTALPTTAACTWSIPMSSSRRFRAPRWTQDERGRGGRESRSRSARRFRSCIGAACASTTSVPNRSPMAPTDASS